MSTNLYGNPAGDRTSQALPSTYSPFYGSQYLQLQSAKLPAYTGATVPTIRTQTGAGIYTEYPIKITPAPVGTINLSGQGATNMSGLSLYTPPQLPQGYTYAPPPLSNQGLAQLPIIGSIIGTLGSLGSILPWALIAYGGYRVFVKKRKDLISIGALALGAMGTGMLGSFLPRNPDGSINIMALVMGAIGGSTMGALFGGVGGWLIGKLFRSRKRRRYYRRARFTYARRRFRRYAY